jgi:hypothetical protein
VSLFGLSVAQFDVSNRYALAMIVYFKDREVTPLAVEVVRVGFHVCDICLPSKPSSAFSGIVDSCIRGINRSLLEVALAVAVFLMPLMQNSPALARGPDIHGDTLLPGIQSF